MLKHSPLKFLRRKSQQQYECTLPSNYDAPFDTVITSSVNITSTISRTDSSAHFSDEHIMKSEIVVHGCHCRSNYRQIDKHGKYFMDMKLIKFEDSFVWFSKGGQVLNFGIHTNPLRKCLKVL
jgi:hypothetical protein